MERKNEIIVDIILLSLIASISFYLGQETKQCPSCYIKQENIIELDSKHGWTKAIYDGNYIQDFYVECEGNKLISLIPLGEQVYVGENWIDSRPLEWQEKWC